MFWFKKFEEKVLRLILLNAGAFGTAYDAVRFAWERRIHWSIETFPPC